MYISVTDWWIQNTFLNDAYFELWIGGSEIFPDSIIPNAKNKYSSSAF